MAIELVKNKKHLIVKRDGRIEPYQEEKMRKVLRWAIEKAVNEGHYKWDKQFINDKIIDQMIDEVLENVSVKIYDKISISKLFDAVIETCESFISRLQPVWDDVTKNLLVQKYYKETWGIKRDEYPDYLEVVKKGASAGIDIYKKIKDEFTEEEIKQLGSFIKPEKDFYFTSLGIKSFMTRYALKYSKTKQLELPQHTFLRLAIKSFMYDNKEKRFEFIKQRYEDLSDSIYTEATPRYNDNDMEASCVLMKMGDDSWSITRTLQAVGLYSKHGGGTAVDVCDIRCRGSLVGVSGESDGVIPFIRDIETIIQSFKQGGVRRGACAVYFNWWHYEVEDLIMLKDEGGNEWKRARSLQYGIKLNRLFLDRIINDEEITLFDPKETPELLNTFGNEFEKWYIHYEQKGGVRKKKIKARDLAYLLAKVRLETGNLYIFFDDNVNENKPFEDYISQSNLCVAPETKILTDEGYKTIKELENKWVNVWNGTEWEEAYVAKTNENAKLIKIETTGGNLECTPYHRFYVQEGYVNKGRVIEKRASELKVGDKLIKFNLPIIDGHKNLNLAYENGFYSGDGCEYYKTRKMIYLYNDKIGLLNKLKNYYKVTNEKNRLIVWYHKEDLEYKFFVPDSSYTIKSRIDWLAGLLDSDGTLTNNNGTQSFQISSVEYEFLHEVLMMLQTLGVTAKLTKSKDAGKYLLPKNDGSNKYDFYNCKTVYRLLIGESGVQKLLNLGLQTYRLKPKLRKPNRNAEQFIKVTAIIDEERYDETYCFNASKTHMGMFNGICCLNCSEIVLPTKPSYLKNANVKQDLSSGELTLVEKVEPGRIALCNLSSINVVEWSNLSNERKRKIAYTLLRSHDNLINLGFYPVKEGEISNKLTRPIGIGITNLAYYFAKNKTKFTDNKVLKLQFDIIEDVAYYFIEASIELAKERGAFSEFRNSKWSNGWLPIDYNKELFDKYADTWQHHRWADLRNAIMSYGIRFSTHFAIAPTATSALSIKGGSTESINPPKNLFQQKTGTINGVQLAPQFNKYGKWYQTAYEVPNERLIELAAIRQLFLDQAQSVDTFYANPDSAFDVIKDIIFAEKQGLKTLYYANSLKAIEKEVCESCSS